MSAWGSGPRPGGASGGGAGPGTGSGGLGPAGGSGRVKRARDGVIPVGWAGPEQEWHFCPRASEGVFPWGRVREGPNGPRTEGFGGVRDFADGLRTPPRKP